MIVLTQKTGKSIYVTGDLAFEEDDFGSGSVVYAGSLTFYVTETPEELAEKVKGDDGERT